jgi:hypothetical protein
VLPLIVFTVIFVILAIAGPWLGADSRDGQDWRTAGRTDPRTPPDSDPRL